jgi:hypothetical protein
MAMATNLIHTNRSLITFDVASKISFIIGEPPAETQQAIETGVPTLAGIGRTRLILRVAHPDCSARLTTLDYRVIPTRILGAAGRWQCDRWLAENRLRVYFEFAERQGGHRRQSYCRKLWKRSKFEECPAVIDYPIFCVGGFKAAGSSGKQSLQRTSTTSVEAGW